MGEGARATVVFLDHCAVLSGGELALLRMIDALGDGITAIVILAEDGPFADALHEAGIQCEVLALDPYVGSMRKNNVRPGGVDVRAVVGSARYVLQLRRRLRRIQPDLVHTNSLKSAVYGVAAARLARIPVVAHVRDRIADDYLPSPIVRPLRFFLRHAPSSVVANSEATLRTIVGDASRRPQSGTVVRSPVIYDPYASDDIDRRDDGPFTLGIVGRIARWKGQDVFLSAFAKAFRGTNAQARIVGAPMFGGDEEAFLVELQQLTERLEITAQVEFTGFVRDVPAELARMDVLVHASVTDEPFGQVVVESMAAGVPVVAADGGGPAEIITHQVDGLLCAPGDIDRLAELMLLLREQPELRRKLALAGRQRAADFAPDVIADHVMTLYSTMLSA